MHSLLKFIAPALCIACSGCVTQAEKEYRERQNRHFTSKDVATKMEQRTAAQFPDVQARMRAAFDAGEALVTPKVISTVRPKYPAGKAWQGVQSGTWVAFVVKEDGSVRDARALPDEDMPADSALVAAAVMAVQQWKFTPATSGGKPMEYLLCVPVLFELRDGL